MAFFPEVPAQIPFAGRASRDPLTFRFYDREKRVGERTMAEHLRFAMAYWHTLRGGGVDPFGAATMERPWNLNPTTLAEAEQVMDAAFEFLTKLGLDFWCFHDTDLTPATSTWDEHVHAVSHMADYAQKKQEETGVRLLWGTANCFSNPLYQAGASTNPDPHVFALAASQVMHAIRATHQLGGQGYVFWGGREGYDSLWNTDLKREREGFARLLKMAVDFAAKIGFQGQFYIEPKPKEPTTHQYDSNVEACLNFLREFDLLDHLKLNVETNHATLAGHSMAHELRVAREAGALGSIDANYGDELIGWDTDQFPTSVYLTTGVMLEVLEMGGFTTGGLNFDAKVRRQSHEPIDLFYAHIGAMDAFARGLEIAHAIQTDGRLRDLRAERYAGWNTDFGRSISEGAATMEDCETYLRTHGFPRRRSGRQELFENLINEFVL